MAWLHPNYTDGVAIPNKACAESRPTAKMKHV
jgi:hypothetical protein